MKPVYALIAAVALLPVTALNAAITTTGSISPVIPTGSTTYSTSTAFHVGQAAAGTLMIDGGSSVSISTGDEGLGGVSDISITGTGSTFTHGAGTFQIGATYSSTYEVTSGGTATFGNVAVGYGAGETSSMTVTGATLNVPTGTLYVGYSGTGNVTLSGGSKATLGRSVLMGQLSGGGGTLTITGAGTEVDMTSTFTGSSGIRVGYNGSSTLNVSNGALLKLTGVNNIVMGYSAGVNGTVNLSGGTIDLGGNALYIGSGTGIFNFTGGTLTNVGAVGTSTVSMPLVQQGGVFSAGTASSAVGSATVYGTYSLGTGATLEVDLAGAGGVTGTDLDYYSVTGSATLGGIVNMAALSGFSPTIGESFNILTASSISTAGLSIPGYSFSTIAGGNGQILQAIYTGAAVPEPASLGLLAAGAMGLVARRRHA